MNMKKVYFGALLILALGNFVLAAINFPWMYYLPYGETVTMRPLYKNDTGSVVVTSCKWTSPLNVLLNPDAITYDKNRYFIDKNNCELTIFNIQPETNGVYHCLVNDFLISKAMLNVHGAPKRTVLEEYTPNLIAGFATAGGVIAFFLFTCALYRFRYKSPRDNLISITFSYLIVSKLFLIKYIQIMQNAMKLILNTN